MNLLTNYPDSLVVLTAELLSKSRRGHEFPYCYNIRNCADCTCYNTKEYRTSNCAIEAWCKENDVHLHPNSEINWESFADAFLNTFTLQKYPHFYV